MPSERCEIYIKSTALKIVIIFTYQFFLHVIKLKGKMLISCLIYDRCHNEVIISVKLSVVWWLLLMERKLLLATMHQ